MKSWLWKGMFAAVISLPALSGRADDWKVGLEQDN